MLSCPKCGGFRIDTTGMALGAIEQMKEAIAYHMKHSKFCDSASAEGNL